MARALSLVEAGIEDVDVYESAAAIRELGVGITLLPHGVYASWPNWVCSKTCMRLAFRLPSSPTTPHEGKGSGASRAASTPATSGSSRLAAVKCSVYCTEGSSSGLG
jgi:hypothetical protein